MTDMRPGPPDSCLGEGLAPFQDGDLDRKPGAQFDRCLGLPDDNRDLVGVDAQLDTPTCGVSLTSATRRTTPEACRGRSWGMAVNVSRAVIPG